jgi:putative solute:sodium symporter small subunit
MKKTPLFWQSNLRLLTVVLFIWALGSFGFSIILADELDIIRIGGFGLGFWMAQQGSIYLFVILILIYNFFKERLDKAQLREKEISLTDAEAETDEWAKDREA